MTRTDPSNGALNRSPGLWHTPASAASLGPAMRPTHYGEVSQAIVHALAYVTIAVSLIHGLRAGSDTGSP